jgi:hypothetical protein
MQRTDTADISQHRYYIMSCALLTLYLALSSFESMPDMMTRLW